MKSLISIILLISVSQAYAELSVKRYTSECVITTVEERPSVDGVITYHNRNTSTGVSEVTTDSARPEWKLTFKTADTKAEKMRTTKNSVTAWETFLETTTEGTTESTTTELSPNIYRDVVFIKSKRWAKPGYDFGENPDGSKITFNTSQLDYDSTYFDDGRITYAISDLIDGVDVPAQKVVYEYSTTQDGEDKVFVQRLVEPYSYPNDPEIKVISEDFVCRTRPLN